MTYIPIDIDSSVKKECRRRQYSERTINTYLFCIRRFLNWSKKELGHISKGDVRLFLDHLAEKEKAGSTINIYHMAIRFLFKNVLKKQMWLDIKYSKSPEKLPSVLTKEEVKKLFGVVNNPKHKLMIQFMYSAGLRVSELINLHAGDLDLNNNYGWIRSGKGNKDRIFVIAGKLKDRIRNLIEKESLSSEHYLFSSNRKSKYHIRSLQQILKNAVSKTKISKNITPHTLRHSFATHLIENGYSVAEVQSLLGHKSPETTFIYLHTASPSLIKVKSPLDQL